MRQFAVGLIALQAISCAPSRPSDPITITAEIDATDILRGIQHAHLVIPVQPGSVTLAYPKWIPGEHAATGPLTQVVGLALRAEGKALDWRRDGRDAFLFHVDVPQGVDAIDVQFDYLSPPTAFGDGYGKTPNVSPHLLVLPFNHVLMYPADSDIEAIQIAATVRIPGNWKFDCALRPERADAGVITMPTVSVSTLVDSPFIAGEHFRTLPVSSGDGATRLSIVADHEGDLAVSDAQVEQYKHLVAEAARLFGVRHYREYVWLVTLGARVDRNGLEHHESTDIRAPEAFFTDPTQQMRWGQLIPHEYVHSWNGKYRRPAGLATRNYQEPMVDDLLWVYEGMTRYLGDFVLRARSGLRTADQMRAYVAWVAGLMDHGRSGRNWRAVGDTATALPDYNNGPAEWTPARRSRLDYYDEMLLVWLEADTIIRQESNSTRSLDDFCRAFFGGENSARTVRPYTRSDLVSALNAIASHDWDRFLTSRVDAINPRAPLGGLENAGWTLAYDDTPNEYFVARELAAGLTDLSLSLGVWINGDGVITDVVHGSPAFDARLAPTMRVKGIDGKTWSPVAARSAVLRAETRQTAIELVVESADVLRTIQIAYHDGLRYPHLVRDTTKPDLLSAILMPQVTGALQ